MSDSKASPGGGAKKTVKRSLPSWISDKETESKAHGKTSFGGGEQENEKAEQAKGNWGKRNKRSEASNSSISNFSNLMVHKYQVQIYKWMACVFVIEEESVIYAGRGSLCTLRVY